MSYKAYKYRIYPNSLQQLQIKQSFGCYRYVYNYFLNIKTEKYKNEKKNLSRYAMSNMLTELKHSNGYSWLYNADASSLQEALKDLDDAFNMFFKGIGNYPSLYKKRKVLSYRTRNKSNLIKIVNNKHIVIPKIGAIKIAYSRPIKGSIKTATISLSKTGKYFISILTEQDLEIKNNNGNRIGIDLGVSSFYTDSNGNDVKFPKSVLYYEKRIRKESKKLSRMIKNNIREYDTTNNRRVPIYIKDINECSNIAKQKVKLAKLYEKINNVKIDFFNKQALMLVKENQIIGIEDLYVKGLFKNHRIAGSISRVSWSKFIETLEHKAKEYGTEIVRVNRYYPSSQTCSCCGYQNQKVKNLRIRNWVCPQCGAKHSRDINAAINVKAESLKIANI